MNRPALQAITCVHSGDFARALTLLPQASSAVEGWVRATCLYTLDQVDEAARELELIIIASRVTGPPASLQDALLAAQLPFTIVWLADRVRPDRKRAKAGRAVIKALMKSLSAQGDH